jgi:hypothetical protein
MPYSGLDDRMGDNPLILDKGMVSIEVRFVFFRVAFSKLRSCSWWRSV